MPIITNNRNTNASKLIVLNSPLKCLLNIFYFMGISMFCDRKLNSRCQKINHAKFCIFNISIVFAIMIAFSKYKYNAPYHDNFGKFNDKLKFSIVVFTHQVTLFETLITRDSVSGFFRLYSKIHGKCSAPQQWIAELKINWKLYTYLGFYIVFSLLVDINYAIEARKEPDWLLFFVSYMPSVYICRCRILQVIMYLELMRVDLLQLNRELKRLAEVTEKLGQVEFVEDIIYKDLTQCMKRYEDIFEMCAFFKKAMPLSPLAIFIATYVKILSDCYWAYWVIYAKFELQEIFECSLLLPSVLNILLVLTASKHCMSAAKLIPQSLHSIRHRVENLRLSRKIQHFSLQLIHQEIVIDASGFFVVDCSIASGILGSITTYMMFYIQFMPKFNEM